MRMLKVKQMGLACLAIVLAINISACNSSDTGLNPQIEGVVGPNVELAGDTLMLSMVFQNLSVDGGATIPIPKYPNSSIQIGPDFQSNGTLLVLAVSVKDFLGDQGVFFDPQRLPGGRPLPSIASGQMPAIAIQVKQLFNTVFYVGPTVIGFFVPFNGLDLQGAILSFRFHDNNGKPIGILSLVGSDQNKQNAGILALMQADLMGIIQGGSNSALKL